MPRALGAAALALAFSTLASPAWAQSAPDSSELWVGYMTQVRISEPLSLWNDVHHAPGLFYLLRTGLTLHLTGGLNATAGYGFLGLAVAPGSPLLERPEHRPWAQVVHGLRLGEHTLLSQRLRHEARFRQNVAQGTLGPGFELTHRLRFFAGLRQALPALAPTSGWTPFVALNNEVLLAFDAERGGRLDQNRAMLGLGIGDPTLSILVSYMHRFIHRPAEGDFLTKHALVVWVFHNLDLRGGG